MKTEAETGTGAGSIEEGASPGASGGRMALLVCLASRAVGGAIVTQLLRLCCVELGWGACGKVCTG